jgi:hypothetical protein
MISGLLKLMRRLSLAGHKIDSEVPFGAHSITDDNPASRKWGVPNCISAPFHFL